MLLLLSDVVTLTDKWYGSWENGSNEGLSKILVEKEADICATGGIMRSSRVPTTDFVVPLIGRFRLIKQANSTERS